MADFTGIIPTYAGHSLCVALHTRLADPVCGKPRSGSEFSVESDPVFQLVLAPYFSRLPDPEPYFSWVLDLFFY